MKIRNKIKFGMFLLIGILLVSFCSAGYIRSNVQYVSSGPGSGGQWQPDRAMCEAGQDFVIQIAPFGCTPAVVRADLLEEQNVPVFCQLGATKINPLIEVEAIESMRFAGKYPPEISGIGFHPAQAALGVKGDLNSPLLNNIGYVVIVLKKQENASAMPEFVTGNLTAEIKYDIQNAFGIGKASFYLPEMDDEEWDKKHDQYGFWQGRGYLRAEGIDAEGARISVYDDTRKIASVDLDKGKTSRMIYLPGFDCLAGFKLKLDGLEAPDTRAKLEINGEIVEVVDEEKFLENRCQIKDIDKKGLVQDVTIRCTADDKRDTFKLKISPKVELDFDGAKKEGYEIGDYLYSQKYIYGDVLEKVLEPVTKKIDTTNDETQKTIDDLNKAVNELGKIIKEKEGKISKEDFATTESLRNVVDGVNLDLIKIKNGFGELINGLRPLGQFLDSQIDLYKKFYGGLIEDYYGPKIDELEKMAQEVRKDADKLQKILSAPVEEETPQLDEYAKDITDAKNSLVNKINQLETETTGLEKKVTDSVTNILRKEIEKHVYLGYVGTTKDTEKKDDLYVLLVAKPLKTAELTESELEAMARFDGYDRVSDVGIAGLSSLFNMGKKFVGVASEIATWFGSGKELKDSFYGEEKSIFGKDFKIIGFAGAVDEELGEYTILGEDSKSKKVIEEIYDVIDGEIYDGNFPNGLELINKEIKECLDEGYDVDEDTCGEWVSYGEFLKVSSGRYVFAKTETPDNPTSKYQKFFKNFKSIKLVGPRITVERYVEEKTEAGKELKKYYESAIKSYDTIINSFSSEKLNGVTYGEQAFYNKMVLASVVGQKKTVVELCKDFKNQYPKSKLKIGELCEDESKLASSEISVRDVSINGIVKRISFEGVYEPIFEEYGTEIRMRNPAGQVSTFYLRHNQIIYLNKEDNEYLQLVDLQSDYAMVKINLKPTGWDIIKKATIASSNEKLEKGVAESFGSGYVFELVNINLKNVAKVSVNPNIKNAGTEANFSFRIGIEQRAIQLSPEKTREKIAKLNKTIADWEEKSEQLGKVVKGLKTACLATGTFLTVKNFFSNTGGKAIARQEVMKEIWNPKCTNLIAGGTYKTLEECFVEEAENINRDVDGYYDALKGHNDYFEDLQDDSEITTKNWLGERSIDNEKLKEKLLDDKKFVEKLRTNLKEKFPKDIEYKGTTIKVDKFVDEYLKKDIVSVSELKSLNLNSQLSGSLGEMAKENLKSDIIDVYVTNKDAKERTSFAERTGFPEAHIMSFDERQNKIPFTQDVDWDSVDEKYDGDIIKDKTKHVQNYKDPTTSKEYILVLDDDNTVKETYEILKTDSKTGINTLQKDEGDGTNKENPLRLIYEKRDASTYQNTYTSSLGEKTPCLRYYETEPYKGFPAVVPFDLKEGWYAWVGQTLPIFGGIKSYEASGRVTSFYVCNVGPNKMEENKGGDDICQRIDTGTGAPSDVFHGLDSGKAAKVIEEAKDAIAEASRIKTRTSGKSVTINGQSVRICKPAVDVPEMQCQNFMSPKECQWLFNVCDPVVCPSSRCNFGGAYHVKDVIQSGIIGSIALCLPNAREGILIPVCLTGIKAGIDGLLSVYTSYRDCLQESLDTGKMVGICDEIYSIHLCEFFWRQSLPLAKIIIPKMMEIAMGQNVHGGGEYLGVASAWDNAEKSIDYFAQYYAASSYQAFKARIVEGVGDAVCQNSISASYPDGGSLLDSLTEPDSPPQFHGRFDEIEFTTATSPPISHYKVFYHIYAGKESRAYYRVYLKTPAGTSFYQDTSTERVVASGYITTGGYATETKDFTAPSGYKELCIVVNNQEECGFKQVSTSYAVNYVNDKYMEEQASERDIKSEKECIGGSVSAYSLLSPSLEGAADELINPAIYDRGIIRICATENPGKGTDGNWDSQNARWIEVGNCGVENIKCWLDRKSVENVIKNTDIENRTLEEHTNRQLDLLRESGKYFSVNDFNDFVKELNELKDKNDEAGYKKIIKLVEEKIEKAFLNNEKARLWLFKGNAFKELIDILNKGAQVGVVEEPIVKVEDVEKGEVGDVEKEEVGERTCQQVIGEKIIEIAESKKTNDLMFDDEIVFENTGAKNFECLILQLSMQESGLQHCEKGKEGKTCLDCDNDFDDILKGDDDKSIGIMQLSDEYFDNKKSVNFKWNVEEGIKHLIGFYNINKKSYGCNGENYNSWKRALRHYNGWGCNELTKYYVEEVTGERDKFDSKGNKIGNTKEELVKLFPECK